MRDSACPARKAPEGSPVWFKSFWEPSAENAVVGLNNVFVYTAGRRERGCDFCFLPSGKAKTTLELGSQKFTNLAVCVDPVVHPLAEFFKGENTLELRKRAEFKSFRFVRSCALPRASFALGYLLWHPKRILFPGSSKGGGEKVEGSWVPPSRRPLQVRSHHHFNG